MRPIKQFNGRGQFRRLAARWQQTGHIFIGATSWADAVRAMHQAGFQDFTRHELAVYFSKNAWGNSMAGIPVERGVWAHRKGEDYGLGKPERLL